MEAFKKIQQAIQESCDEYNRIQGFRLLDIASTLEEINQAIMCSDSGAEEQTTIPEAWAVFLCIWDD